jgi:hypothetical protein
VKQPAGCHSRSAVHGHAPRPAEFARISLARIRASRSTSLVPESTVRLTRPIHVVSSTSHCNKARHLRMSPHGQGKELFCAHHCQDVCTKVINVRHANRSSSDPAPMASMNRNAVTSLSAVSHVQCVHHEGCSLKLPVAGIHQASPSVSGSVLIEDPARRHAEQ